MRKAKVPRTDCDTKIDKYFTNSVHLNRNLNINAEATGVDIIELDKSSTSGSDDDLQSIGSQHAWCYTGINRNQIHDNYHINKEAREKRRMKNKVFPEFVGKGIGRLRYDHDHAGPYSSIRSHVAKGEKQMSNTLNCFTIIKKEFDDSESSSDKENGPDIAHCGDVVLERNGENDSNDYSKEIKHNKRLDSGARTILIYSFKNRNILNLGDTQTVDRSSEDSSSESPLESRESEHLHDKTDYKDRVASPTPALYIPRLNFYTAATLPTVTEVTEPYQLSLDNFEIITNNTPNQLTPNNIWLKRNSNELHGEEIEYKETHTINSSMAPPIPSNNIMNWMALSPRVRKRHFIIPNSGEKSIDFEENLKNGVHVTKHEADRNDTIDLAGEADLTMTASKPPHNIGDEKLIEQKNSTYVIDGTGDHKTIRRLKKPQINLEKIVASSIITDPIEKLNGDRWIGQEYEHTDKAYLDMNISRDPNNEDLKKPRELNRCAGDRLFSKNMSLLKPVEWSEYLPITGSTPSLHLSLPSDINDIKRPWFKRFIGLFQCCIKCK